MGLPLRHQGAPGATMGDLMQDFRTSAHTAICRRFCTDAPRFPTDNCRRCWVGVETLRIRDSWHKDLPKPWPRWGPLADDILLYVLLQAGRMEPPPCASPE